MSVFVISDIHQKYSQNAPVTILSTQSQFSDSVKENPFFLKHPQQVSLLTCNITGCKRKRKSVIFSGICENYCKIPLPYIAIKKKKTIKNPSQSCFILPVQIHF